LTEGLPATPAHINLTGGCLASNIFWQTTGDVTITPGSVFNGNILSKTQVIMQGGAVLHGRALAQSAVTLIQNTVGP
jgi:cytoskeletal protein CcmA (bactofilin family)